MWQSFVERYQSLTKEQRISMVVLGLCGIIAMGLSVYHINNSIKAPFMVDRSVIERDKKMIGETDEEKIVRQKRMDTDGDGLSDWDEGNVYHTNPNLRDSCGDGIADNVRVVSGKNLACLNSPNAGGSLDYSQVVSTSSDLFGTAQGGSTMDHAASLLGGSSSSQGMIGGDASLQANMLQRDPSMIRQALIDSGQMKIEEIDALTDQQLLEVYDQAVEADSQGLNPNSPGLNPVMPGAPATNGSGNGDSFYNLATTTAPIK